MLRTPEQVAQLQRLQAVDSAKRLYVLDYTEDYHLPRLAAANVRSLRGFVGYLGQHDLRLLPGLAHLRSVVPGCSCFYMCDSMTAAPLMGRNFDYLSPRGVSDVVLVRTHPEEGYSSMGLMSLSLLSHPPHSLSDSTTDLSLLWAAPYLVMDGINEKGFFVSVLYLDGEPTQQHDDNRHNIMTLTAIRLLLDNAATVEEAKGILESYNMFAGTPKGSYHFFVGDTTGRHAVLEYTHKGDKHHWDLSPVEADYVTNFYLNEGWRDLGHGYDRYDTLAAWFLQNGTQGSPTQAMNLLQAVAQKPTQMKTSNTQWSAVYDLKHKKLLLCLGRNYNSIYGFEL